MPSQATRCRRPQQPTALQRKEAAAMQPTQTLPTYAAEPSTDAYVTRRFDGQPETDTDRRFFDLRETGYLGWIDHNGHPVDGPTFVHTVPTVDPATQVRSVVELADELVTPAVTLRAAATYLDRHGWIQGGYYAQTATV